MEPFIGQLPPETIRSINWNRAQEEFDFHLVFHEEAVRLTHTSAACLRLSEPLKARLYSLVDDSHDLGPLLMHASFQVLHPMTEYRNGSGSPSTLQDGSKLVQLNAGIKDINFLTIEQRDGDLFWEFDVDQAHPNGYIEHDTDVREPEDTDSSEPIRLDAEEQPLQLPPNGWLPLKPGSITQWHTTLAPRLRQLYDENPHTYHGRGIQMRTHVGWDPPAAFLVQVGIERPVNDQYFPVWYHQWDFELQDDRTWSEFESAVRVRMSSDG